MQHHVFLSYSRKDSDIMHRLRQDLHAADLQVWTDESLTPGTESWKNAIETAIQNAGAIVVLLSPDSKQSIWVEREMDYARACGVPIIPVLVRGEDEVSAIPFELINAQRVDVRHDYAANVHHLIEAVKARFDLSQTAPDTPPAKLHSGYVLPTAEALDSWNFLDQIRLLGWLFLDPAQYLSYRQQHGMRTIKQTGAWLASDLAWIALLLPSVGFALGMVQIPGAEKTPTTTVVMIVTGLLFLGGWFVTAWIGWHENHIAGLVLLVAATTLATLNFVLVGGVAGVLFVAGGGLTGLVALLTIGVALGMAAGLAFQLANSTTGALAGLVIAGLVVTALTGVQVGIEMAVSGIAMTLFAFGVGGAIDINLRTGQRSWLGLVMLGALPVNLGVMLWTYFLGGWQILMALQ